jgi:hypothetical protein
MRYIHTGSAARTTLITLVAIAAFLVVAITLLPKGFSSDTSVIGQGSHVVVLAHNNESMYSLNLMDSLNKVRSEYSDRIEFRVVDMNTPTSVSPATTSPIRLLTIFRARRHAATRRQQHR